MSQLNKIQYQVKFNVTENKSGEENKGLACFG